MTAGHPAGKGLVLATLALGLDGIAALALHPILPAHLPWPRQIVAAVVSFAPLCAHFCVTVLLIGAMLRFRSAFQALPGAALLVVLMALLGPIGTLVGWSAAVAYALVPASWPIGLPPAATAPPRTRPVADRAAAQAVSAEARSLCDIFRHGSLAQRRRAVALMAGNFKPEFAPAFQMALQDEHNAIRVQAGMALLALEDEFGRQQMLLQTQQDADGNPIAGLGDELALARLFDRTAYSGLLDPERTRTVQAHALRAYKDHLAEHPDDEEAIAAVGRLLVRADQPQLVVDWFGEMLHSGRPVSDAALMWLAEALYLSRRYEALTTLLTTHAARLDRYLPVDSPLKQALQLWWPPPTALPAPQPPTGDVVAQ